MHTHHEASGFSTYRRMKQNASARTKRNWEPHET